MTTNMFRSSLVDGSRVQLSIPAGRSESEFDGMSAMVLRCLGCAEDVVDTEQIDYLVKVDGVERLIVVSSEWIA